MIINNVKNIKIRTFHHFLLCYCLFFLPLVLGAFNMPSSPYKANLSASPIATGVILIICGFVFLFFGIRLFKPIIFLTGVAIGGIVTYIILLNIINNNPNFGGSNQNAILFLVPVVVGILVGSLLLCILKMGVLALGALGGFSLSTFILSWQSGGVINSNTWRPVFISVMMIVGSILTLYFERILIIICTSLFGAGAICSGVDFFLASGFNQALNNIFSHSSSFVLNDKLVGLLISYVILALVGMLIQFKFHRHIDHKSNYKK